MLWLKRLKASKKNLVGPDFEKAPWYDLDLSGTKVRFRNPPQTAMYPNPTRPYRWNIYNAELFELWPDEKGMTVTLFKNGWNFYDHLLGQGATGGIDVQIILQRKSIQIREYNSFFYLDDLIKWELDVVESGYGEFNKRIWDEWDSYSEERELVKENHFWRYPKTLNDIKQIEFNGLFWHRYEIFQPNEARKRVWRLPISDDHILGISFKPSAIQSDYFDPSHNLDEAVENTVHTFMSNFHVKLSPDAQQRYDTVKAERKKRPCSSF